jgi:biopolymer transport protein ExbD
MAGPFTSSDDEVISGINVTPLVDVVLVLLVIFMVTAPVIYQSTIQVQLPKAQTGEPTESEPIHFTLTKDGTLHWDRQVIQWSELEQRLKALGPGASRQSAVITADEETHHGTVIRLMDSLRQAGISRLGVSVTR